MKLNALRKLGALTAVSVFSLGYAVAGPYMPPPVVESPPPPPLPPAPEGGLWDTVGATLSVGYDTDYIFRGLQLGHDSVWTQLDLTVPLGDTLDFTVGAWYQNAFNGRGDSELDLYASLGFDFGAWGLELGYTHYYYPEGFRGSLSHDDLDPARLGEFTHFHRLIGVAEGSNGGETNEAYISVGTTVGPVDVAVAYYYDFDLEVSYAEATAGTTFELTPFVSLDPSVGISYIDLDDAPHGDDHGFNNFFARVDLPIALTSTATLTPYVATSVALDLLEDLGENDYFWGGIALSVDF